MKCFQKVTPHFRIRDGRNPKQLAIPPDTFVQYKVDIRGSIFTSSGAEIKSDIIILAT
jgi:hypothetical protein